MKKFLKLGIFALALLPLSLLSACGQLDYEPKLDVNSAGAYSASTKTELNEIATDETTLQPKTITGYRMTMTMKEEGMNMKANVIATLNDEQQLEMAMKINMSTEGTGYEGSANMEIYMPVGEYMYANIDYSVSGAVDLNIDGKYKVSADEGFGIEEIAFDSAMDFDDMLDMVDELSGNGFTIEKATRDTKTNFKVSIEENTVYEIPATTMYFLFDNGALVGYSLDMGETMKIVVEAFDGTIQFPSFDNYREENPFEALGM